MSGAQDRPGAPTPEERAAGIKVGPGCGCDICTREVARRRADIAAAIRAAVAEAETRARAEERELCIADCRAVAADHTNRYAAVAEWCAERIRIRARGSADERGPGR